MSSSKQPFHSSAIGPAITLQAADAGKTPVLCASPEDLEEFVRCGRANDSASGAQLFVNQRAKLVPAGIKAVPISLSKTPHDGLPCVLLEIVEGNRDGTQGWALAEGLEIAPP